MANDTPDQKAAEKIGRAIDGQIFRLNEERTALLPATAAARVADIDAELLALRAEKVRIDARRPPPSSISNAPNKVGPPNVP